MVMGSMPKQIFAIIKVIVIIKGYWLFIKDSSYLFN